MPRNLRPSRRTRLSLPLALVLFPAVAAAQVFPGLTLPPSGGNQKSSVSQWIGPVEVRIEYSSPDVHAPNGDDRRGKIWGELVPHGLTDPGFGTCKACPWRAGANENTVLTVSHDVEVEGKKLPAGRYGLHFITGPEEWTLVLSKNSTSWGSFYYDPADDALRATVKPRKAPYREWLSFDFVDRDADRTTVELQWEELAVPVRVVVPAIDEVYYQALAREMRNATGFAWQARTSAVQFLLGRRIHLDTALAWAQEAATPSFTGTENFTTLSVLAQAQEANGQADAAKATMAKAIAHPTAGALEIHAYGRQLLNQSRAAEALTVFELNAKRNPDAWFVDFGLARGLSAVGRYKEALAYAKKALPKAPDEANKASVSAAIAKLEKGEDMNR